MLQVLVSSTFSDLKAERETVRQQISILRETHAIEWVGMENFGALAATPLEVSTGHAAQADVVVLIVGGVVGSVPPDEEASFTQLEFETALSNKIPCLAYFAPSAANAADRDVRAFHELVRSEVTHSSFVNREDLADRVRIDLERELAEVLAIGPAARSLRGPTAPSVFVNRSAEVERLTELLTRQAGPARVALIGGPGVGKTALMKHVLDRVGQLRIDPTWLALDGLLGRDPDGRRRVRTSRVGYESMRSTVEGLVMERPRALLIIDNAQADPRATRWLAEQFPAVPICCLTWDQSAIPYGFEAIRVAALRIEPSVELLALHCAGERAEDEASLAELAKLLDGYALALDLAGRRLRYDSSLTPKDLLGELDGAAHLLALEGPTLDKSAVQIRSLLKGAYQTLRVPERKVLSALAALPSTEYSDETVGHLTRELATDDPGLRRALELGLIERRQQPDFRGHRFRMRSVVRSFLTTTDAFAAGQRLVLAFLGGETALRDSSSSVVGAAIANQALKGLLQDPRKTDALSLQLVDAPHSMRAAVRLRLSATPGIQRIELEQFVAGLLGSPRRSVVTVELLGLLETLGAVSAEARGVAKSLWQSPETIRPEEPDSRYLDPSVMVAAGRVLARSDGQSFSEWLGTRALTAGPRDVERVLDAAGRAFLIELLPSCRRALASPVLRTRVIGARSFGGFLNNQHPEFRLDAKDLDSLCLLLGEIPHPELQDAAAHSLALWGDDRCLPHWLGKLGSANWEERNSGVINIRHFSASVRHYQKRPFDFSQLLNRASDLAMSDPVDNVRVHATLVLIEAEDRRAVDSIKQLLAGESGYGARMAPAFVGMVEKFLDDPDRHWIADRLAPSLASSDPYLAAWACRSLLDLKDARGLDSLWEVLERQAAESVNRWHVILGLSSWNKSAIKLGKFRRCLSAPDPVLRAAAAEVAGDLGLEAVLDDLESLLIDDAPLQTFVTDAKTVGEAASLAVDKIVPGALQRSP